MDRRRPDRIVELAPIAAREERERDRDVRRAVRRETGLADRPAHEARGDRGPEHARGLALVARRTDRREPLDVLHRAQAGADSVGEIRHGRVAFEVDEVGRAVRSVVASERGDEP